MFLSFLAESKTILAGGDIDFGSSLGTPRVQLEITPSGSHAIVRPAAPLQKEFTKGGYLMAPVTSMGAHSTSGSGVLGSGKETPARVREYHEYK